MDECELYFCHKCRCRIENLDDLLLVEEKSLKGFCTEECIREFYQPYIEFFELREKESRKELDLIEEDALNFLNSDDLFDKTLHNPNGVFMQENEIGEEIYFLIKEFQFNKKSLFMIVGCLMYEKKPSFIFFQTTTYSEKLREAVFIGEPFHEYQGGESTEGDFKSERVEVDQVTSEVVGQKRSSYLAELLELRSEADIPYEDFSLYESYLNRTLEDPDEVFRYSDEDSDVILVYIKSYEHNDISFYYLVLSMHYESREESHEEVLVPLISFPSLDGDLYKNYKRGERISGAILS